MKKMQKVKVEDTAPIHSLVTSWERQFLHMPFPAMGMFDEYLEMGEKDGILF